MCCTQSPSLQSLVSSPLSSSLKSFPGTLGFVFAACGQLDQLIDVPSPPQPVARRAVVRDDTRSPPAAGVMKVKIASPSRSRHTSEERVAVAKPSKAPVAEVSNANGSSSLQAAQALVRRGSSKTLPKRVTSPPKTPSGQPAAVAETHVSL